MNFYKKKTGIVPVFPFYNVNGKSANKSTKEECQVMYIRIKIKLNILLSKIHNKRRGDLSSHEKNKKTKSKYVNNALSVIYNYTILSIRENLVFIL